jgi:PAS domain S-box-containing protein
MSQNGSAVTPAVHQPPALLPAAEDCATWEWDLRSGAVRVSAAVLDLLGGDAAAVGDRWAAFRERIAPADRAHVAEVVRSALEHGERWAVRFRVLVPDGPPAEVLEHGYIVRGSGAPVQALGVLSLAAPRADAGAQAGPAQLSEDEFHTFIDALPQLAWTARPDGWVDFYNRQWFEYTGTTFEQMEGWGWIQVHDPNDLPRMLRIWRNAHVTGQPWEDEFRMRRGRDGMLRWHLSRALPYRDANGRIVRWFGTNTDIHDQKLAAEEYSRLLARERRVRREAEAANRAKDEFLALVSHELRTPLNAVLGWAQILRRFDLNDVKRREGLEKIERNAQLQAKLIEDLLDISRIITGKLAIGADPVDLGAAVAAAVETARPSALARSIELSFADESGGARVAGSAHRVEQIAGNLLSNAIKFSKEGGRVEVALRRAGGTVELVVRDEGEGIGPELLPHLFERFRQADSSSTRRFGGLGLGLFVVGGLAPQHPPAVDAPRPRPGRGATFTVRLPLLGEAAAEAPPPLSSPDGETADAAVSLAGIKVLGVDDEPSSRDVLAEVLHGCGATVTLAGSVHEALRAFKIDPPDVVVSDIAMPELDGYALIQRVREMGDPSARRTPVIALTAYASLQDRERALAAGFDRYLSKPLDAARLSRLIADLVRERVTAA